MVVRNALVLIIALVGIGPALGQAAPGKPSTDPHPIVRIEGDTLTYIGAINAEGLDALSAAVRNLPREQVTRMVVNSGGGDTNPGIFIGSIIADLKPHLVIETGCFSSCANFIAPAAASITIRPNAFLGWHGNDRGFAIVAAQKGITLREHLRAMVKDQAAVAKGPDGKPADFEAYLDEAVPAVEALIAKEAALYQRMGLANDTFAVCGVGSRFDNRLTGDQLGWGFSIPDMARLGLPPVRYAGPGRYEESSGFRRWLIQLTPEDCKG
jgi:ATP-dependent protease ClpP protease subunit